jgi:hypothetical protein
MCSARSSRKWLNSSLRSAYRRFTLAPGEAAEKLRAYRADSRIALSGSAFEWTSVQVAIRDSRIAIEGSRFAADHRDHES